MQTLKVRGINEPRRVWVFEILQEMEKIIYIDEIKYFTETLNRDLIICADRHALAQRKTLAPGTHELL